jgi:hypothetical protein
MSEQNEMKRGLNIKGIRNENRIKDLSNKEQEPK